MSDYDGSEADAMWDAEMSAYGAEGDPLTPEFEVVRGRKNDRVFSGSRKACWDFKSKNGGFVRAYSGEYSHE